MHGFSQANSLLSLDVAAKILTMGIQQLAELIESGRVDAVIDATGCYLSIETVNELFRQRQQAETEASSRSEPPQANWRGFGASANWLRPFPSQG